MVAKDGYKIIKQTKHIYEKWCELYIYNIYII